MDVHTNNNGYQIDINYSNIGRKLDYAQLAVDTQAWQDVQRYMPLSSGQLKRETNTLNATILGSGKVYVYPPNSPYGHYQYKGIVYKDPLYNVGGFYSEDRGWWSRKGVSKVPSTQLIRYSQPNAHREWGQYAIDHHKNDWMRVFKRAMQR
jgi:hypothetical protein